MPSLCNSDFHNYIKLKQNSNEYQLAVTALYNEANTQLKLQLQKQNTIHKNTSGFIRLRHSRLTQSSKESGMIDLTWELENTTRRTSGMRLLRKAISRAAGRPPAAPQPAHVQVGWAAATSRQEAFG